MKTTVQSIVNTPLGSLRLAVGARGLLGAWFIKDQQGPAQAVTDTWPHQPDHSVLAEAARQLAAYFRAERKVFELPLDLSTGTPFQTGAWSTLLGIPWGQTISYGELAQRMGRPAAARAAGVAIGRNPLSIIVPCHRVIGANGSLTGYAGGLPRKSALLQLEGHTSRPF
jgi:methylated-DNA-[protein]-cysteine S-methyltransferase